jgi:hypothetical protein
MDGIATLSEATAETTVASATQTTRSVPRLGAAAVEPVLLRARGSVFMGRGSRSLSLYFKGDE